MKSSEAIEVVLNDHGDLDSCKSCNGVFVAYFRTRLKHIHGFTLGSPEVKVSRALDATTNDLCALRQLKCQENDLSTKLLELDVRASLPSFANLLATRLLMLPLYSLLSLLRAHCSTLDTQNPIAQILPFAVSYASILKPQSLLRRLVTFEVSKFSRSGTIYFFDHSIFLSLIQIFFRVTHISLECWKVRPWSWCSGLDPEDI